MWARLDLLSEESSPTRLTKEYVSRDDTCSGAAGVVKIRKQS